MDLTNAQEYKIHEAVADAYHFAGPGMERHLDELLTIIKDITGDANANCCGCIWVGTFEDAIEKGQEIGRS